MSHVGEARLSATGRLLLDFGMFKHLQSALVVPFAALLFTMPVR
jgi:hypothetical protein